MTTPSTPRLEEELRLIQARFPSAYHIFSPDNREWIVIPDYPLPEAIWNRPTASVAHSVSLGHPAERPYGIYVEGPMLVNGTQQPSSYAPGQPGPTPGVWGVFSFYIEPTDWKPAADAAQGSNLLIFLDGFSERLAEGV